MVLDTDGEVDIVKGLILSDSDTDTVLSDMTYKSLVTILGQKFVDEYRSQKRIIRTPYPYRGGTHRDEEVAGCYGTPEVTPGVSAW
jgi:hypothetical protein